MNDNVSPQAKVTIKVRKKGTSKWRSLNAGLRPTNSTRSYSFKCKLARGTWIWKVAATDLAGNAYTGTATKTLKVK